MTDELVKRLREWWNYDNGRLFENAITRIEALTKERDGLLRCVTDNHVALCRAEAAEAERERLREALSEIDKCIVWEALGFGNDFADEVQAALKGESHG